MWALPLIKHVVLRNIVIDVVIVEVLSLRVTHPETLQCLALGVPSYNESVVYSAKERIVTSEILCFDGGLTGYILISPSLHYFDEYLFWGTKSRRFSND